MTPAPPHRGETDKQTEWRNPTLVLPCSAVCVCVCVCVCVQVHTHITGQRVVQSHADRCHIFYCIMILPVYYPGRLSPWQLVVDVERLSFERPVHLSHEQDMHSEH